jgi:hypothetical protein
MTPRQARGQAVASNIAVTRSAQRPQKRRTSEDAFAKSVDAADVQALAAWKRNNGHDYLRGVQSGEIERPVKSRFLSGPKLRSDQASYDEAIAARGLRTVIVLRLTFFIAPWAHWLLGLTKVRFRDYVLGTTIGLAPMMALFTWGGAALYDYATENTAIGTLILVAVLAAFAFAVRHFKTRVESGAN